MNVRNGSMKYIQLLWNVSGYVSTFLNTSVSVVKCSDVTNGNENVTDRIESCRCRLVIERPNGERWSGMS